jgi:hypothetical protein
MLQNRIYRGEITHKGNAYPGEHTAILDKALWEQVQAKLAANRVDRIRGAKVKHPSLLTGMVFDEAGQRLTPTYSLKRDAVSVLRFRNPHHSGGEEPTKRIANTSGESRELSA